MERRKTKISVIGVCLILIMSVVLAVFGITNVNKTAQGSDVSLDAITGADTVAATDSTKYIGGVVAGYKDSTDGPKARGYVAITSGAELRSFLLNEGKYQNANGYLDNDITDFNWDDHTGNQFFNGNNDSSANTGQFGAGLSPRVALNRKLDGCGYTINFEGEDTKKRPDLSANGVFGEGNTVYAKTFAGTNTAGYVTAYNKSYLSDSANGNGYCYAAFGGLVAALQDKGELRNFTFKIQSTHTFLHDDWNAYTNTRFKSVVGGLVGLQENGSVIDNVAVELSAGNELGVGRTGNANGNGIESTSIVGLVTGVSDGGTMTNVKSVLAEGSYVTASAVTRVSTSSRDPRTGVAYAGGVLGYVEGSSVLRNLLFEAKGANTTVGAVRALTAHEGSSLVGARYPKTVELMGTIAAYVTSDSQIESAMVTGNMNCLRSSSNGTDIENRRKGLFVPDGKLPETQIYMNATGGTNNDGDKSNNLNGYHNNQGDVIFINSQDIVGYFDKGEPINVNLQLFIPENKVMWQYGDKLIYDDMISGKDEDDSRRSFEAPKASSLSGKRKSFYISIGTIVSGSLGFYEKTPNGDVEDEAGNKWKEVSDQVRVDADKNPIPLYYNGTAYEIKILANFRNVNDQPLVHDAGLTIRARGDLTNARSANNGRPVSLYTRDASVAYKDETNRIMVMLDGLNEGDMEKTLTIDKRLLGVETDAIRGVTGIYDGATVKFTTIDNEVSGLAGNDTIKWQDANFPQDKAIDLNVAGHQMLRPSTNNYILMLKRTGTVGQSLDNYEKLGSYFATEIMAHEIEVDADIYINGEAIRPYQTREEEEGISQYGIFKVKNARIDNAKYNDEKRKITITVRVQDSHFDATRVRIYDKDGVEIKTYKKTIGATELTNIQWLDSTGRDVANLESWANISGLITATIYVNDDTIASIRMIGREDKEYSVTKKIDGVAQGNVEKFAYGQRTSLEAPLYIEDNDGNRKVFVGWQREKDNSFVSYQTKYSLKVTEDFVINAVYDPIDENIDESKTWTQEYYGKYGSKLRTIYYVSENSYSTPNKFKLPDSAGFLHAGEWTFNPNEDVDSENRVIKFHAIFTKDDSKDENDKLLRPIVNVIWVNSAEHADDAIEVDYGQPIILKEGNTYLVNNTLLECDKDYIIYALNDFTIIENPEFTDDAVTTSMVYSSFEYAEWGVGDYGRTDKYFLAFTFAYGDRDAEYTGNEEVGNKPILEIEGFDFNDVTEYVRCGNIYQISMVITKQEIECRFGNDSEISAFLKVVKSDGTKEQIGNIMIFRRKSTDTSTQKGN